VSSSADLYILDYFCHKVIIYFRAEKP